MPFNPKNSKKILPAIIALIITYYISYLMLKGVGAPRAFFHTILLVFLITLCSSSKKIFWFFIIPFSLIYALYAPIGFTYGTLTYDFLIAGLATDSLEASEFIHQIPYRNYALPFVIIGGLVLYRYIITRFDIHFFRNKTFLFVALIIMLASQTPMLFIKQIKSGVSDIYNEQQSLNTSIQQQQWGDSLLVNSNYDNYILIIGESARKDYLHAYGYPINNTPFMSQANGVLVDGFTSGGSSTVPSLKAMLTLSDKTTWNADYTKTFIGLAKSAGIKTYWLSNQGYSGSHDSPISAIAMASDEKKFLKYGSYDLNNTSDFELLPTFEKIISENPTEKKLIVIHLYGSHPDACDRVDDYHLIHEVNDPYYNYLNCYVSSIHKTDKLLEMVSDFMQQESVAKSTSFSMLYFADHGLFHREINESLYFSNSGLSKFHYDVPLFMTSSDSNTQQTCQSFKSGLNFTSGVGNWMGIHNENLDPNYSLFDCKDDPDDFGLSNKLRGIEPDYPIDLRGK